MNQESGVRDQESARGKPPLNMLIARLVLVLAASVIALLICELLLTLIAPHAGMGAARELPHFRKGSDISERFTIDPQFGFRPKLGTDLYDEYGALTNSYPREKSHGTTRILFIGDSVTARGHLVDAISRLYPSGRYEFWNAGVESFNTVQEVAYYKAYNAGLLPDHVILSFHLNDFETTPVVFRTAGGRLNVYAPNMPGKEINTWLFRHSRLYRLFLGMTRGGVSDTESVVEETYRSLADFKEMLSVGDIRLTVLILPLCKPYSQWSEDEKRAREVILSMLSGLGIRHFDLREGMERSIVAGIDPRETEGDYWHPSREAAEHMAEDLRGKLLGQGPGKGVNDTVIRTDPGLTSLE